MSLAWGSRLTSGSLSWGARESSTTAGVINGSAVVREFVERDLVLTWQLNGGVESDLTLLWQLDASPITAVESDLTLTWNIITAAATSVEVDLVLLWQRGGSVQSDLLMEWRFALGGVEAVSFTVERSSVRVISTRPDARVSASQYKMMARAA